MFFGTLAFLAVMSVRRRLLKGAMGAAWLSVSLGAYLIWDRFGRPLPDARPWGKAGTRRIVTVVLVLVAVAVVVIAAQFDPLLAKAISSGADNVLRR